MMFLAQAFPGINGFLGTRGSLMLDVVVLAMFAVLPVLAYSVYLVQHRQQYALHKRLQLALGVVLLITVALFEVDMQFLTEWELRAEPSPYFNAAQKWTCPAGLSLLVHLAFAVPTAALWLYVIVAALRGFPSPAAPGVHSRTHKRWGKLAGLGMLGTAVTGWVFYYLAFVA